MDAKTIFGCLAVGIAAIAVIGMIVAGLAFVCYFALSCLGEGEIIGGIIAALVGMGLMVMITSSVCAMNERNKSDGE